MLTVNFHKVFNHLLEENMVIARLVNQQVLDFNSFCEYLSDGSTVTSADCAAVMKQIEMRLPLILALNAKVMCSPEGLCFRPAISGSITQSQLKKKLEARLQADPTLDIDVNRELQTSDLAISDLTASIAIELPRKWNDRFMAKAEFKRFNKGLTDSTDGTEDSGSTDSGNSSGESSNGSITTETLAAPVLSGSTPFTESTSVTITGPSGAQIRYTTDGSTPTSESTLYSEAITLSDTATVKAIAIKDGTSSEVASKTFTKTDGGGNGADAN